MASGISEENSATNTAERYPTPANLQDMDGTSMPPDPTAILNSHRLVDARSVTIINYKKASPISLLSAKEEKLSLDDRNPMPKIKSMNGALEASGFFTLVIGGRAPPIATINNPNGYRSKSVIMEIKHGKQFPVVIPEDGCYCFDSEKEATCYLLMLMIDPNLHHLIKEQIADKDPERIYKELLNHFAGHKQHHIEHAKYSLEHHLINPNAVILSISVLREKLLSFEDAQASDTTEPYRCALLQNATSKITEGYLSEHYTFASMSG